MSLLSYIYLGGSKKIHSLMSLIPALTSAPLALLGFLGVPHPIQWWVPALLIIFGGTTTLIMYLYPKFTVNSILTKLNLSMPHLILRTRTLLMAGEPPLQTFIRVAEEIKSPILQYLLKSIATGETPESVMNEIEDSLGKNPTIDRLKRIVLSLSMGSQAESFLKDEFEAVMEEREEALSRTIENLSMVVELYMAAGVFFPVIGIVLLTSLSILGGVGLDINSVLVLIIFVAIPILSAFTAIMAKKMVEEAQL